MASKKFGVPDRTLYDKMKKIKKNMLGDTKHQVQNEEAAEINEANDVDEYGDVESNLIIDLNVIKNCSIDDKGKENVWDI